ncbi:MAG: hypothetical protein DMD83_23840, partial [Candidatus Rokuibacteriota bacterium]
MGALLLWPGVAPAVDTFATDDAYVVGTVGFGNSPSLVVSSGVVSLIKFDLLNTLPSGACASNIQKATLKLFVQ